MGPNAKNMIEFQIHRGIVARDIPLRTRTCSELLGLHTFEHSGISLFPELVGTLFIHYRCGSMLHSDMLNPSIHAYFSADSANGRDALLYPTEFLNTLEGSGLPPHTLNLRKGRPVILIRDLNIQEGLASGTGLVIDALHKYSIEATVTSGPSAGHKVAIPRLPLMPTDRKLGVDFTRVQFPVVPAMQ